MTPFRTLRTLLVLSVSAASLFASNPDYAQSFRWTNRTGEQTDGQFVISGAGRAKTFDNSTAGCVGWKLTYAAEGFSALSINLQTSPKINYSQNSYGPSGTWSTYGGTATTGTLPMTSTAQGTYIGYGAYPYVAVNVSSVTGTGSIDASFACWTSVNYALAAGGGGGGGSTNGTNGQVLVSNGSGGFGTPQDVTQAGASNSLVETTAAGGIVATGGISAGSSPPAVTGSGILGLGETTGQACVTGADCFIADSASHRIHLYNNGTTDSGASVGSASTDTFTNKTFDTAGSGNVLKVAGTQFSSVLGNTTKVQMASTNSGVAGATLCNDANSNTTTSGCSGGGGSTPVIYIAPRVSITSNNTEQAVMTYTSAPALAAGGCRNFKFALYSATIIGTIRVRVDGTLIATPFTAPSLTAMQEEFEYCNQTGVQNAQKFFYYELVYNLNASYGSGTEGSPSDTDARLSTPSAIDWSTTHTITITSQAATGTAIFTGGVISDH